jgi:predicted acyltransferase
MFIVGVAMPFSFGKRWARGENWGRTFKHALQRSFILLLLGWALYCIGPGKITFELWNVLAQLSVTYLIAFLLLRQTIKTQLIFTFVLLIISEMLYRLWPVAGFDQPFVPDHNFGSWFDMLVMGKLSGGHWVAFNAFPTTAHTMWGVLAGLILSSDRTDLKKIKILLIAGLIGVVAGYALNPITPIIKRICTSSFVIVSGGWCLVVLAFSYWLVDVRKIQTVPRFFAIVGMNPIFIYLFMHTGGANWLHQIVMPFVNGVFSWMGDPFTKIINALVVLMGMWYICYWLFQKKIFIKI